LKVDGSYRQGSGVSKGGKGSKREQGNKGSRRWKGRRERLLLGGGRVEECERERRVIGLVRGREEEKGIVR